MARDIASRNGTSISSMFSRFIRAMVRKEERTISIGPLTRKATGMLKVSPDFDEKKALQDALTKKYGIDP